MSLSATAGGHDNWWSTAIIDMAPNRLVLRGYHIEDLVGRVSYVEMVYLMLIGRLPSPIHTKLLEAVLVAGCDHGIASPAVAAARMAATCGVTINSAVATGINLLGDIHGGASELVMQMLYELEERSSEAERTRAEVAKEMLLQFKQRNEYVPGFGHPVHDDDPRVHRLFELVEAARARGEISGRFIEWIQQVGLTITQIWDRRLPINIDGAVAVVQCELALPAASAKPLFCLSRAIGICAHVLEELEGGQRLKGPVPSEMFSRYAPYRGNPPRELPPEYRERDVAD